MVVLYTLAHLGQAGKHYVHRIIGHCSNYNRHVTEKWIRRLKPFPISCPKIREMLCDITPSVGCYCKFPRRKNSYPTPVLHADPDAIVKLRSEVVEPPASTAKEPAAAIREKAEITVAPVEKSQVQSDVLSIDEVLRDYMKLKRSMKETSLRIGQIEAQLESMFDAAGGERLQTYLGELTRVERNGQPAWIIEI